MPSNIGLTMYNWRMKERLSLEEAANWLGLNPVTVQRLEQGTGNPSNKTLEKVQKVLGDLGENVPEENSGEGQAQEALHKPFTQRLAEAYPDLQKRFDTEQKNSKKHAQASASDLLYLIGYFEGVATASGIDMTKQIEQLKLLQKQQENITKKENYYATQQGNPRVY